MAGVRAAGVIVAGALGVGVSARPLAAQNAVRITVTAEVLESPLARAYGGASELGWIGTAVTSARFGAARRVELGEGLAALSADTIEPGHVRARLEYVGN